MCTFCSPAHANLGESRWQEKEEKGIRMGVPPQETDNEALKDNTDEL